MYKPVILRLQAFFIKAVDLEYFTFLARSDPDLMLMSFYLGMGPLVFDE